MSIQTKGCDVGKHTHTKHQSVFLPTTAGSCEGSSVAAESARTVLGSVSLTLVLLLLPISIVAHFGCVCVCLGR